MNDKLYLFLLSAPLILSMFILGLLAPKLSREDICFGVIIPEEKVKSPEIINLTKQYYKNYLLTCGICLILFFSSLYFITNSNILLWEVLIFLILWITIYSNAHSKVNKMKKKEQWVKTKKQVVLVDTTFRNNNSRKLLPSLKWFIIPICIIVINILLGFLVYERLPLIIPTLWTLEGKIGNCCLKNYGIIFCVPAIQLFITMIMLLLYKIIGLAKQQISSKNPELSKERNRIFRYRWASFMIYINVLLLIKHTIYNLYLLQIIMFDVKFLLLIDPIFITTILISIIFMSIWTGQSGSRIKVNFKNEDHKNFINKDDDKHWKLGVFYFNRQDPSLFVEHRFTIGWGLNFGRALSYILIISSILSLFLLHYIVIILISV